MIYLEHHIVLYSILLLLKLLEMSFEIFHSRLTLHRYRYFALNRNIPLSYRIHIRVIITSVPRSRLLKALIKLVEVFRVFGGGPYLRLTVILNAATEIFLALSFAN